MALLFLGRFWGFLALVTIASSGLGFYCGFPRRPFGRFGQVPSGLGSFGLLIPCRCIFVSVEVVDVVIAHLVLGHSVLWLCLRLDGIQIDLHPAAIKILCAYRPKLPFHLLSFLPS